MRRVIRFLSSHNLFFFFFGTGHSVHSIYRRFELFAVFTKLQVSKRFMRLFTAIIHKTLLTERIDNILLRISVSLSYAKSAESVVSGVCLEFECATF